MGFIKNILQSKRSQNVAAIAEKANISTHSKLCTENVTLIRTLGTGSFGRVFLAKLKNDANAPPLAVKRLKKAVIIRQKQVDHIISERDVLSKVNHPFVVNLLGSYKDDHFLYIAMEYVVGGEFFTYLRRIKRCEINAARFYAAQVTLVFEYLHARKIIFRDLKPENLLLASTGYLKLTDFGFAKVVEHRTFTLCGTPEYIAPEVLLNRGHGKAVDWWTLGILIYEMIVGYPPFFDDDPMGVYQKILAGRLAFPGFFHKDAKTLVRRLLSADLSKRYGNLVNGADDIKLHKWFEDLSFENLYSQKIQAPYVPSVKSLDDASNFEPYAEIADNPPPVTGSADPFIDW